MLLVVYFYVKKKFEHWPMTKQLTVQVVNQSLPHSFLYSSNAPVPLLGRDLLIKLGASILCSPEGVIVTFPDGTQVDCSQTAPTGFRQNVLLGGPLKEAADIYWGELNISRSLMTEECKSCLAFTYRGRQYSYNRLPQGFILSLGIFNQVLKKKNSYKMHNFPRLCLDNVC